jgi:hypothetical protein
MTDHRPPAYPRLSRRSALKAGALAAVSALSGLARRAAAQDEDPPTEPFDPGGRVHVEYDETLLFNELYGYPPMLGRVEARFLRICTDPMRYSRTFVRNAHYADVLPIYGAVHMPDSLQSPPHNDVWFDVGEGYIHSSWVVPVQEVLNEPEPPQAIGEGFWGEITVPTSWQHWEPKLRSYRYFDMAYGAVFRVVERADEPDGRAWYRLEDDISPTVQYWVQAAHVRRIQPHEFDPISPQVPPREKRIEVNLRAQTVTCYEYSVPVFSTRCATGTTFIDDEGRAHEFKTPRGEYLMRYKRASRHMRGGAEIDDAFDLPGVPWCSFFTFGGIAIHGTYWHNDYGRPRSHGCVNVTPDAAKWIFRWCTPAVRHNELEHLTAAEERATATRVIVA